MAFFKMFKLKKQIFLETFDFNVRILTQCFLRSMNFEIEYWRKHWGGGGGGVHFSTDFSFHKGQRKI